MSQVDEKLKDMPESIVTQAGVSFVASEYEALGKDVDAIQMDYMKSTGLRMILMALITMMAAVCVVFLSSRVAASLGHDLRNSVYNKVIGFSSREYHKFSTASLITRCTNDIQRSSGTDPACDLCAVPGGNAQIYDPADSDRQAESGYQRDPYRYPGNPCVQS